MLSLAAPWWLLGLLALPAIRWLHRTGPHRLALPVSHLALWRGAAAQQARAGAQQPPDPAWRRRAWLAALLCVALAGPQWPSRQPGVTLWVDDSISMLTQEVSGTRLAVGMAQVQQLLAATPHSDVEVRALSNPWRAYSAGHTADPSADRGATYSAAQALQTPALLFALQSAAASTEPGPPPAALLRRERLHWLLTDGTDANLINGWPCAVQADHVVQVGTVSRNVGIQSVSARRRASAPDTLDLLVKVTNGGAQAEAREVVLSTAAGEVARVRQRLAAGTSAWVRADMALPAGPAPLLRATLLPGDALSADDSLALDLAPLRRQRVRVDPRCPPALRAAVSAHPAFVAVVEAPPQLAAGPGPADVQAALDCGAGAATPALATLRVRADAPPQPLAGPLQWSAALPQGPAVRLEAARLPVAARLKLQAGDAVLLAAGDQPVVVRRAASVPVIETALDFSGGAAAGRAEVPLLVNLLFENLLGQSLLDTLAVAERGTGASQVVPATALPSAPSPGGSGVPAESAAARESTPPARAVAAQMRAPVDGTRPVVMLVLAVLLWELVALARQWLRLSGRQPARVQPVPSAKQGRP